MVIDIAKPEGLLIAIVFIIVVSVVIILVLTSNKDVKLSKGSVSIQRHDEVNIKDILRRFTTFQLIVLNRFEETLEERFKLKYFDSIENQMVVVENRVKVLIKKLLPVYNKLVEQDIEGCQFNADYATFEAALKLASHELKNYWKSICKTKKIMQYDDLDSKYCIKFKDDIVNLSIDIIEKEIRETYRYGFFKIEKIMNYIESEDGFKGRYSQEVSNLLSETKAIIAENINLQEQNRINWKREYNTLVNKFIEGQDLRG